MINLGTDEIIKRYSQALHSLGLEEKKGNEIKQSLLLIKELIEKNKECKRIIFSPLVTSKKHQEILKSICLILKIDKITENFLFLLAFNKRLNLFEKIFNNYNNISSKEKDIVNIDIILANKITQKEIEVIKKKLKSKKRSNTKLNFIEDKNIISGFIVKHGSTMIDYSTKSKLDKIINSLR